MNPPDRPAPIHLASMLVGLALVGLVLGWSIRHPQPSSTIVDGRSFDLGTTPLGEVPRHSWEIVNRGSLPLKLRTRFTSGRCGFSLWLGEDHFVPAGSRLTVWLTCPTPRQAAVPYSSYAEVTTNDPESPKVRFRVYGITGPSLAP